MGHRGGTRIVGVGQYLAGAGSRGRTSSTRPTQVISVATLCTLVRLHALMPGGDEPPDTRFAGEIAQTWTAPRISMTRSGVVAASRAAI